METGCRSWRRPTCSFRTKRPGSLPQFTEIFFDNKRVIDFFRPVPTEPPSPAYTIARREL